MSYLYSYQHLMETRQAAEGALRKKFKRQAFNDFVLAQDPVPPALLRKAVLTEFVAAQSKEGSPSPHAPCRLLAKSGADEC